MQSLTFKIVLFCGKLRSYLLNKSCRGGFELSESVETCRTSEDAHELLATENGQV